MASKVVCEKCKKEIELKPGNSKWYDDDENELGEHKWDVAVDCPICGYHFWVEVWDDFTEECEE